MKRDVEVKMEFVQTLEVWDQFYDYLKSENKDRYKEEVVDLILFVSEKCHRIFIFYFLFFILFLFLYFLF